MEDKSLDEGMVLSNIKLKPFIKSEFKSIISNVDYIGLSQDPVNGFYIPSVAISKIDQLAVCSRIIKHNNTVIGVFMIVFENSALDFAVYILPKYRRLGISKELLARKKYGFKYYLDTAGAKVGLDCAFCSMRKNVRYTDLFKEYLPDNQYEVITSDHVNNVDIYKLFLNKN